MGTESIEWFVISIYVFYGVAILFGMCMCTHGYLYWKADHLSILNLIRFAFHTTDWWTDLGVMALLLIHPDRNGSKSLQILFLCASI